ncbi:hypothetical protein [Klenkia brasiliensis]|uniref:hypothetical protein n=1 Tax=Klenkia brasiliensis TaxID=333142 RepID=UPI000B898FA0|nr:hypothetical protein [Klenkia brasiliensis]
MLVLAGCSDPQPANDTLPTAVSTSASPSLEPLGPADFPVPDEAREQTQAGAEAMARYYLDLLDQTKAAVGRGALDVEPLRSLATECETCDQVVDGFVNADSMGYTYEGGDLADPTFGSAAVAGASADLAFSVQQAAARVLDQSGAEVRSSPDVLLRGGVVFRWDSVREAWIATQLNLTN